MSDTQAIAARLTADPVQLQLDILRGFDDLFDLTVSLGVLRCLVAEKQQAEQQRDAAHAALREISRDAWAALAQTQDMKLGGFAERIGNAADAALAASAPQKEDK